MLHLISLLVCYNSGQHKKTGCGNIPGRQNRYERREGKMKKTGIFMVLLCAAALSGCATESYVKEQVDPLNARLCNLEAKVGALENKMNDMDGKMTTLSSDVDAAKQAAADAASKADAAAQKADAAAQKADACAARCGKAFELGQKK